MSSEQTPISVVIITKNEEDNIRACIESVLWADEVVVVDSGSSDSTCSIAESLDARVVHQDWLGYGAQKHFATEQAKNNWVLSLDADERISQELADNIINTMHSPQHNAYALKRLHFLLGRPVRHGDCKRDWVTRLFHRQHARFNTKEVHEAVDSDGAVGRIAGDIEHFTAPSLGVFIGKLNGYTDIQAKQLIEKNARIGWIHLTLVPFWRFVKSFIIKGGFLDGIPGLVYAYTAALTSFLKHAKVLDRPNSSKR